MVDPLMPGAYLGVSITLSNTPRSVRPDHQSMVSDSSRRFGLQLPPSWALGGAKQPHRGSSHRLVAGEVDRVDLSRDRPGGILGSMDYFRVDDRDIEEGEPMWPDRRDSTARWSKEVEAAFVRESKPSRKELLFVFDSLEDAENYRVQIGVPDRKIYRVRVDEVLHKGDMRRTDQVNTAIEQDHPDAEIEHLVDLYWEGQPVPHHLYEEGPFHPIWESLCTHAVVLEVIQKEGKRPALRAAAERQNR